MNTIEDLTRQIGDLRDHSMQLALETHKQGELVNGHKAAIALQAEVMADTRRRTAALEDAPRVEAMASAGPIPLEQDDACVTMRLSLNELKTILEWRRCSVDLGPGSESGTELAERLRNAIAVLRVR